MATKKSGTRRDAELAALQTKLAECEAKLAERDAEVARTEASKLRLEAKIARAARIFNKPRGSRNAALRELGITRGETARHKPRNVDPELIADRYIWLLRNAGGIITDLAADMLLDAMADPPKKDTEAGCLPYWELPPLTAIWNQVRCCQGRCQTGQRHPDPADSQGRRSSPQNNQSKDQITKNNFKIWSKRYDAAYSFLNP